MRTATCLLIIASFLARESVANPALIDEHVFGGLPSDGDLMFRTAYVLDYDAAHKAPRWSAKTSKAP